MEDLFDLDKPYFAAWVQLHDMDTDAPGGSTFYQFTPHSKSGAVPLYYAALCGFQDLVEHLVVTHPQHVNANGGYYLTPLVAALGREHYQTAKILRDNGAHPNVTGNGTATPLHAAAYSGHLQMVRVLLEYGADVNARSSFGQTPLHFALDKDIKLSPPMATSYLRQKNARSSNPLRMEVERGRVELVRLLLDHGACVGAEDGGGRTPLQLASSMGHSDMVNLLSERCAK
jgi:ankyrin repeat protein